MLGSEEGVVWEDGGADGEDGGTEGEEDGEGRSGVV